MKISLFLMIFIIITFLFPASATDYTIDNDLIYIDDSNIYLSACPHTLNTSGYVYFNLTSKQYSGDIDFFFGFDSLQCKPISAEVFLGGNWIDISHRFNSINYTYDGLDKWYYLKEISIDSNTNYTLRAYLQINEISTGGKYGVAVKPFSETISQSINNGHFYYLDPWWSGSWLYRKTITLTGNTSGAQTDYQLLLNVTYDSDMQADFDDLRFTNDTHQIDAWLELNTTDYALVWVEFPTTPINDVDQDYYMYYGNGGASSDWDGDATFEFFEDFSAGTLDNTKWEVFGVTPSFADGIITLPPPFSIIRVSGLYSKYAHPTCGYALESRVQFEETNNNAGFTLGDIHDGTTDHRTGDVYGTFHDQVDQIVWAFVNGIETDRISITKNQVFQTHRFYNDGTNIRFWVDNVDKGAISGHADLNVDLYIQATGHAHSDYDGNINIDYVRNRKYATNPATYVFGAEELFYIIVSNPTNLQNTTGNFWINHTWQAGGGNITDSYNVSVNNVWYNDTINAYWNVTYPYSNNSWQNITIRAYNNTNIGYLSTNSISQNTQLLFTNLPTNLQETHDYIWINWTWGGNFLGTHIIDSYNVSIDSTWYNGTTNQFYKHTELDYKVTSSIVVYGYNNTQGLSIYYILDSYTPPTIYKIIKATKQLVTPIQIIKDKFFNIIPFIISIILFAVFGLAIVVMTSRLKKW